MPPGTIHAVLTTEDSVITGGQFLCDATLDKTLVTALMTTGGLKLATNGEMNGPMVCAFDRHFLRRIQGISGELERLHQTKVFCAPKSGPLTDDLLQFATSDWMVGLLFADCFFPRTADDISDLLGNLESQHQRVLQRASLFLRWISRINPELKIAGIISKRIAWFFDMASKACVLNEMMDESAAFALLQLSYGLER